MGMHNFRKLKIWQRSMDLVEIVYKLTDGFPREEKYGMISHLQRWPVSIPSNISEGAGRGTNKQFLEMSMGSFYEVQTQIEVLYRFNYISKEVLDKTIDEAIQIYKMILAFYNSLKD